MAAEPRAARAHSPHRARRLSAVPGAQSAAAPLSAAQEALWYQSVLFPQEIVYNETVSVRHDGPLDAPALRRALEEIITRHEIWRTTFDVVDGDPIQIVHPAPSLQLPVLDLSALTPEQAEARAVEVIAEVSRVPYDVRRGPLLRPRLMRFPAEHQRLYVAIHHIIFDGVSIYRTVVPELIALYEAFAAGHPSPLQAPVTQYGEFARWEQEWIETPRAARRIAYWREHLVDASALALPTDRPRPPAPRFRGAAVGWDVPVDEVAALRAVAAGGGATLFQALGAAWALMLGRRAGQDEVVFGTPADLRRRPELESMVGYCLSPLVVRVSLADDPSFAELVRRTRNDVLDGLDQLVPFERIVRELRPERERGINPFYQTMLVLEPAAAAPATDWSLLLADPAGADALGSTRMDLELQIEERPDGHLAGRLIYDRDLFDRSTTVRMVQELSRIVTAVVNDPELPVSRVPLLTPAQEHLQTVQWNATASVDMDAPQTLAELFAQGARRDPDAPALIAGEGTMTYGEIEADPVAAIERLVGEDVRGGAASWNEAASVNLALGLADEVGIGPGDTVVVLPEMLRRSPETELWPALAAGATVVLASREDAGSGAVLSRLVRARKATLLHADPPTWQALVNSGLRGSRTLRALSGPGPLDRELADAILDRCRMLFHGHGTAAAGAFATLGLVRAEGPVTIGRPLPNRRAYVLDRHGRPMSIGVAGELMLAGPGAAPGTEEDPFAGGPAVRTGERARWLADGRLELL
jgi:non-ribosomal peptide synthetase component F